MKNMAVQPLGRALLAGILSLTALAASAAGMTALQKAIHKGDLKKVKELLDKGANINEWEMGTPLMFAASDNKLDIAKFLIEKGANLNDMAKNGSTALGMAAQQEFPDMVDLLIGKGADLNQALQGLKTAAAWFHSIGVNNDEKIIKAVNLLQGRAGMAYYSSGQYDKAAAVYQSRVQANPQDGESFIGLAFSMINLKKLDEAKTAAESAMKFTPSDPNGYVAMADVFINRQEYARAFEPLKKAVALNAKDPWIYNRLGNACFGVDDYQEALANFQKAAELAPKELGILQNAANTRIRLGDFDAAIASISQIIEQMPAKDTAENLGVRSILYREKGMLDQAAQDAGKAASIDPANEWALAAQGAVALDKGDYEGAVQALAAIKDQEFGVAVVLEAIAFAKKGDMARAEELFWPWAKNVPTSKNPLFLRNGRMLMELMKPVLQGHLEKARSLEGGAGFREALGEYALAVKLSDAAGAKDIRNRVAVLFKAHPELAELPEEARKYTLRGDVLVNEKDLNGAVNEYLTALDKAPFHPPAYYNLAVLSAGLNKFSQAVGYMNAYLDLAPSAQNVREAKDLIYRWEFQIERGEDKK